MKKIYLLLLAAALSTSSCALLDELSVLSATINGLPIFTTLSFSNTQGDQKSIQLISPIPWTITEYPDWLSISPLIGDGSQKIVFTVITSNNSATPLTGQILFLAANGDKLTIRVQQGADPIAQFKNDATPRWETGTTIRYNRDTPHTFITDKDGKLFSSTAYKTGRITSPDGSGFEVLEFNVTGPPATGTPSGALLRTPSGATPLYRLEIVKVEGSKLWIVFQETSTSLERRVVQ
jgi:hypothetical protein